MPTARGWAALGVATSLLALWVGFGEVELMTTAVFLVSVVAVAIAFVRVASPWVTVGRRLHPAQTHEGDEVVIEVDVIAQRRIRNLELEDSVHGLGIARFAAAITTPGQPLVARYSVYCRKRGIYQVGPAQVSVSDPLSLTERRTQTGAPDRLTVYPRVERLSGFPSVRAYDPAQQATRPTFSPQGGEDFFTLREYQTGDDMRRVHWPSSAKRDELMIRQLEVPWQARALVLLDVRADRYETEEAFEQAVRGSASAIAHLYEGGFSPELWTSERAPGLRSGTRYQQALEILAGVQTKRHFDLRRTVNRLRRQGVGGGALVIVTGVPDNDLLTAHRALTEDFTRAVVMAVVDRSFDDVSKIRQMGAATVFVRSDSSWAPAWRTAMELSWSTASAG